MTKSRVFRWSLIFIILAAFAVWLEPTRVVWGWLRGEAFYQGRPTSWWERELAGWEMFDWGVIPDRTHPPDPSSFAIFIRKEKETLVWLKRLSGLDTNVGKININIDASGPLLVQGDPAAEAALRRLLDCPDPNIRRMVRYGLTQIERVPAEPSSINN